MVYCCHGSLGCVFLVTFLPKYHGKSPFKPSVWKNMFPFFPSILSLISSPMRHNILRKGNHKFLQPLMCIVQEPSGEISMGTGYEQPFGSFCWQIATQSFLLTDCTPFPPKKKKNKYGNFLQKDNTTEVVQDNFPFWWFDFLVRVPCSLWFKAELTNRIHAKEILMGAVFIMNLFLRGSTYLGSMDVARKTRESSPPIKFQLCEIQVVQLEHLQWKGEWTCGQSSK